MPIPTHYPVTSLCIVADAQKCPPGYDLLLKSHDKRDDCDLWREGLVRRVTRYLCFSRVYPINSANNVVVGISITDDKVVPPIGFTALERTVDTSEKALRKKCLSIKISPRDTTSEAVCDIILLSKTKRAPEGYTLVGDIHGLALCYKVGKVPVETQQFSHSAMPAIVAVTGANRGSSDNLTVRPVPPPRPAAICTTGRTNNGIASNHVPLDRGDSITNHPLYGVPFQLNPKYSGSGINTNAMVPSVLYRSLVDIEEEYNYKFSLERSTSHRSYDM